MKTKSLDIDRRKRRDHNIYYLLRIARGMDTSEVAEKIGKSVAYVSLVESGERKPKSDEDREIYAKALHVDPDIIKNFDSTEYNTFKKAMLYILNRIVID